MMNRKYLQLSFAAVLSLILPWYCPQAEAWHLELDSSLVASSTSASPTSEQMNILTGPSVSAIKHAQPKPILIAQNSTVSHIPSTATAEQAQPPMSLEEVETMLDYHQYTQAINAMRSFVSKYPDNAQGWLLLSRALDADKRPVEANQARQRAIALGAEQPQRWHASLQLSALVDSNVVISPNDLSLAARDKGDIGGTVQLNLSGQIFESELGNTQASFQYDDMLYQDFNNFALRRLSGSVSQHVELSSHSLMAGIFVEQSTLGNASMYAGYAAQLSDSIALTDHYFLNLFLESGKRNFSQTYSSLSAWRSQVNADLQIQWDGWDGNVGATYHIENTKGFEEAYRSSDIHAKVNVRLFELANNQSIWSETALSAQARNYNQLDARPYLKRPLTRQDRLYAANAKIKWLRAQTLWGSNIPETWFIQGGWMKNQSNINQSTTFSPANSRQWRRWMVNAGVLWRY
ncbi:MAG: hypothetical protein CO186_05450 [Zetaproteobacteria bacterium CG_4_9_14_3_um_filter_49_83]|nr:MAG: hypothetical protein AUJ56_05880 [Zetaproteobacteria bacterium CG1_02_49_23]PIQ32197.1 MAG: hypothetical protein COW62_08185 [Zetaproteobacteria bacterium CG17_big_fil_post_rev_8_21_14_2_50_50_13]PIV29961.1 MAG: hypothetical protein COS35_09240 [Zetaproteobacteria bacterium CG02_land_8_20_14_3_00_50_9]PIY57120.1 MAG: hypothetical protein COZ00_00705 [Zetaproteobacteria bacterium CG_4_10_14_0_8_um_filter_49_80]PJA35538.1 MAG: hypothetical protein CO186_05450 [Zetaproteobacteria bacterium